MTSVVIPVYENLEGLKETLKALELQTKKIFMTIIVNDSSIDTSMEDYQKALDETSLNGIVLKTEQNGGCGAARQVGLDYVRQKDIFDSLMFLDAGDYPFPYYVEFLTKELKRTNSDIMASSFYRDFSGALINEISQDNMVWMHGKIFSLKFLRKYPINFFTDCRVNEDILFLRTCKVYNPKMMTLPYQTMLWKQDPLSTTNKHAGRNMIVYNGTYCARLVDVIELELTQEKINKENILAVLRILYLIDQKEGFYYNHSRPCTVRVHELLHNKKFIELFDDKFIKKFMHINGSDDDDWYYKESQYEWFKFYNAEEILEILNNFGKRDDIYENDN